MSLEQQQLDLPEQRVLNRQHAHVAQERAGLTQWNPDLFPARGGQQAAADERLDRRHPVDPAPVEGLDQIRRADPTGPCMGFKYDINRFFASRGIDMPQNNLKQALQAFGVEPDDPGRIGGGLDDDRVAIAAGHRIIGVDPEAAKVALINEGTAPIVEAEIAELIAAAVQAKAATLPIGARFSVKLRREETPVGRDIRRSVGITEEAIE